MADAPGTTMNGAGGLSVGSLSDQLAGAIGVHTGGVLTVPGVATLAGGVSVGGGGVCLKRLTGSVSWNPPTAIPAYSVADLLISVPGATVAKSTVACGVSPALAAGLLVTAFVSAPNVVTVRLYNWSSVAVTPAGNPGLTAYAVVDLWQ